MIHLNTQLSKRNEDVNEVDNSFEHTLIKEKWRCKQSRWFVWTHIYQGRNEDVNEVDNSFEHTLINQKWKCNRCRWFVSTHIYQREMKM